VISALKKLEKLEIWDNPIRYISPEISQLKNLKSLRIDDDNLTALDKQNLKEWLPRNCIIDFQTRGKKN
jgi:Leucine-rich repeat (LRR) protein